MEGERKKGRERMMIIDENIMYAVARGSSAIKCALIRICAIVQVCHCRKGVYSKEPVGVY